MDMLSVGRIGAPHGLDGRLKVLSYSGEVDHFPALGDVVLRSGERQFHATVESAIPHGPGALVKFTGYDSPEVARELTGFDILVSRDKAAPKKPGEYYIAELVGCDLVDQTGKVLARVVAVCDGGAGDLLEVQGSEGPTVLIPFRDEFIGVVDIDSRRIELVAPWILH